MGAVQRLATVVIIGLVALATVLVLYLADESNRIDHEQTEQQAAAIERGRANFLTLCLQCHGPAGEGYTAAGESGTGRIGAPIGGNSPGTRLNQQGLMPDGTPWSNPDFGSGVEGRANYIRNRIINGQVVNGNVLMPPFGEDKNGPLNDEQVEELIVFIQHNDWNETYNEAIDEYGGYPTAAPKATEAADMQPTAAPSGGGGQANAGPIDVEGLDSLQFSLTEMTIPANTDVTVNFKNAGALTHSWVVEGQDINTGQLAGGDSKSVTVNLPPGTYTYICDVPGHKEAGMVGTLTVVEGGGAPAAPAGGGADSAGDQPAGGAAPGDGAAAAQPLEVDMQDALVFAPNALTIPAGTDVKVTVKNSGVLQHSFVVEGQPIDSGILDGGATTEVTINLPAGTYTYICGVPGHKEAGMVGTLTVQ